MIFVKCSKCGAESRTPEAFTYIRTPERYVRVSESTEDIHLCPECTKELKKWIKGESEEVCDYGDRSGVPW